MTTPEKLRRRQRLESLLIAVLCALLVAAFLVNRVDEAEDDRNLQAQADAVQAQADRNTASNACVITWAQGLITELQKRDAVLRELRRGLDPHADIGPYPIINPCFTPELDAAAALILTGYHPRPGPCWGRPVTILGTRGSDTINGTKKADVIFAGRGADRISGVHGNDYICAGRGADIINGGPGRDSVRGGAGVDLCIQTEVERGC